MGGIISSNTGPFLGGSSGSGGSGIGATIVGFAINVISGISFKSIRDKAKAKKALAIAQAGGYNTLTSYQKSLITQTSGGFYESPENAGNTLDFSSVLIFIVIIVVLFSVFRPARD
jgi:hypothetical protein